MLNFRCMTNKFIIGFLHLQLTNEIQLRKRESCMKQQQRECTSKLVVGSRIRIYTIPILRSKLIPEPIAELNPESNLESEASPE